ncbi:FHA domain-containing protein [Vulcanococcus limneticus]|uniref:FHA domain-containing protein n=1 Tax=Vulcanococcus limneticus TaxID=2170428 RepID=UPI00398C0698
MAGSPSGIPPAGARLSKQDDPTKAVRLHPQRPLTIGRDTSCGLCLPQEAGLSRRHAAVRLEAGSGRWLVEDLGSANGTYVNGQRIGTGHPLADGDAIQLGRSGPVLLFQLEPVGGAVPASSPRSGPAAPSAGERTPRQRPTSPQAQPEASPSRQPQPPASPTPPASPATSLEVAGERIPIPQIRSAAVRSQPVHPHLFSWWVLVCLGGLLLLPVPVLFWPLQIGALVAAVLLGSRKQHTLVVVLHDGTARRRAFANRLTALSHRNGIRKAIGQSLEA